MKPIRHANFSSLRRGLQGLLDTVFPPVCLFCRGPAGAMGAPAEALCPACRELLLQESGEPFCSRCGYTTRGNLPDGEPCPICDGSREPFERIVRLSRYQPAWSHLIHRFKYHGQREIGALFVNHLAEALRRARWFKEMQAITCVPAHWTSHLHRPYHAADELARGLSRRLRLPAIPLLRRVRRGRDQVGLTFSQRQYNVRGLFAMTPGLRLDHARILLVDDVRTTGATLDTCCRTLRKAGAAKVFTAVVLVVEWAGEPTQEAIDV